MLDSGLGPGIREVGAKDELTRPNLGRKVAQSLRGKYHRVVIHLPQILARLFLDAAVGSAWASGRQGEAAAIRPRRIGRQEAASVRGADPQSGEAVQGTLEDEMRQRDRGLEGVADHVFKKAIALQPTGERARRSRRLRVNEDQNA